MNTADEFMASIGRITRARGGKWYRRNLSLMDASETTVGTVDRTAGPNFWRTQTSPHLLQVLRDEQYEVRDNASRCVRRIVGPKSDPPAVRVLDADDREVLRLEEAIAPWNDDSEPCLHIGDQIVGAFQRRGEWAGPKIFDSTGQVAMTVVHRSTWGRWGGKSSYQIELPDRASAPHEPFASAALLAVLSNTRYRGGGG
jgi:hypothetical protein